MAGKQPKELESSVPVLGSNKKRTRKQPESGLLGGLRLCDGF